MGEWYAAYIPQTRRSQHGSETSEDLPYQPLEKGVPPCPSPPPSSSASTVPEPSLEPVSNDFARGIHDNQLRALERQQRAMDVVVRRRLSDRVLTLKRVANLDPELYVKGDTEPDRSPTEDRFKGYDSFWEEVYRENKIRQCIAGANLEHVDDLRRRALFGEMRRKGLCRPVNMFEYDDFL